MDDLLKEIMGTIKFYMPYILADGELTAECEQAFSTDIAEKLRPYAEIGRGL